MTVYDECKAFLRNPLVSDDEWNRRIRELPVESTLRIRLPNDYKVQEKQMTRKEAYKKLCETQQGKLIKNEDIPISQFCDFIEALGLIKFDEEKTIESPTRIIRKVLKNYIKDIKELNELSEDCIGALYYAGYVIKQE